MDRGGGGMSIVCFVLWNANIFWYPEQSVKATTKAGVWVWSPLPLPSTVLKWQWWIWSKSCLTKVCCRPFFSPSISFFVSSCWSWGHGSESFWFPSQEGGCSLLAIFWHFFVRERWSPRPGLTASFSSRFFRAIEGAQIREFPLFQLLGVRLSVRGRMIFAHLFVCFRPSLSWGSQPPHAPPTPFFEVNLLGERYWPNCHEISNIWVRFPLCPNTSENLFRKILFPFCSFPILGRLVNFIIRHEEHFVSQNLKCPSRRAHCSLFWGGLLPPPQPQTYFDSRQPWLCSPRRRWKTAWSASRQPQISMLWRIAILLWNRSWKMPKSRRMCSSNSGLFSTRTRFYVPTHHLCRSRSWYASTRWTTKTRLLANFL